MTVAKAIGWFGAFASAAFTTYAGRHGSSLLTAMFVGWVVIPWIVLLVPEFLAQTANRLALPLAILSTFMYGYAALSAGKPRTPIFLLFPLATWIAMGMVTFQQRQR